MYITLGNKQFRYYKSGRGPHQIILIPGGPGLTIDYLEIIHKSLPEDFFTVISYQPSGTFGNIGTPFLPSIHQYAQELMSILDNLDIKNCSLIGHSWGAVIVQEFLASFPDFPIDHVVLANCFSSGRQLERAIKQRAKQLPDDFRKHSQSLLANSQTSHYIQLLMQYWLPNFFCRVDPLPEAIEKSLSQLGDSAVYYYYLGFDLLQLNGALIFWDRSDLLHKITCPVLVITGEYDYLSLEDNTQICSQIRNCVLWFMPGTSHMPMYEQPREFSQTLLSFLSKQNIKSTQDESTL